MDVFDLFDGLQFDNQLAFNQYIQTVSAIEPNSLLVNCLRRFELELDAGQRQFARQTLPMGRFEQPRAQFAMNFYRTANYSF